MKRVIYISTLVLAFGFVSCNKQDFRPNNETNQDTPTWEKDLSSSVSNDGSVVDDDTDGDEIVDPNFDPDGRTKRD